MYNFLPYISFQMSAAAVRFPILRLCPSAYYVEDKNFAKAAFAAATAAGATTAEAAAAAMIAEIDAQDTIHKNPRAPSFCNFWEMKIAITEGQFGERYMALHMPAAAVGGAGAPPMEPPPAVGGAGAPPMEPAPAGGAAADIMALTAAIDPAGSVFFHEMRKSSKHATTAEEAVEYMIRTIDAAEARINRGRPPAIPSVCPFAAMRRMVERNDFIKSIFNGMYRADL